MTMSGWRKMFVPASWALFFVAGVFVGLPSSREQPHGVNILFSYVYRSTVDEKLAIAIKPDGSSEIGPMYDRKTEAIKLFELIKAWRDEGRITDCHETSFRSPYWSAPDRGVMEAWIGPWAPVTLQNYKIGRVK